MYGTVPFPVRFQPGLLKSMANEGWERGNIQSTYPPKQGRGGNKKTLQTTWRASMQTTRIRKKLCEKDKRHNRRYKLRRLMAEIAREYNATGRYLHHNVQHGLACASCYVHIPLCHGGTSGTCHSDECTVDAGFFGWRYGMVAHIGCDMRLFMLSSTYHC